MSGNLLNAVTSNTVGAGVEITGDFEVMVPSSSSLGGGEVVIQSYETDTDAAYVTIETFIGPGARTIRNNGTKFFRAVLKGVMASMPTPSATVRWSQ